MTGNECRNSSETESQYRIAKANLKMDKNRVTYDSKLQEKNKGRTRKPVKEAITKGTLPKSKSRRS